MNIVLGILLLFFGFVGATAVQWIVPGGLPAIVDQHWGKISQTDKQGRISEETKSKRERGLLLLAQASVEEKLFDPYSAVFESLRIVRKEKEKEAVCGFVNAKNRFGAYVGKKPFVYEALIDFSSIVDVDEEKIWDLTLRQYKERCGAIR